MTILFKNIVFLLKNRFVVLGEFFLATVLIQYYFWGVFLPSTENKDLWFYSGIFMLIFSILFIEPYYTSPKNVITNAIPLLLVLLAIRDSFNNTGFWWTGIIILIFLIVTSIIAISLDDNSVSPDNWKNKISTKLKNRVVLLGQGKILYSAVFLYFLYTYYSIQNFYTLVLFILWFFVVSINPKNIHNFFLPPNANDDKYQIGGIFSVQSKKIFLVKIFEDKQNIQKFDLVKFKYSMQENNELVVLGIVFDTYLLNREKWGKILQLSEPKKNNENLEKNIVYKITNIQEIEETCDKLRLNNIVGIVVEGSSISKIKFEYSKKNDDLQEGDLLELSVADRRLFYQVINGTTEKEKLEDRNETCFIEGEAIQLGEWQSEKLSFQKFGWVPSINTAIYKADTTNIQVPDFKYPLYKIGNIPGTTLPSVIDLYKAVGHHLALIGITGSGKTFLAQEIIKELSIDTKIICVDLTGEWNEKLKALSPSRLIDSSGLPDLEKKIAQKEIATKSKQSPEILKYKKEIQDKLIEYIKMFAESRNNITVFELPDLSNTSFILEFTQMFMEGVFLFAKENPGHKFCIVLEEAHTVIPETSFLGDLGEYSSNKGLVSKMGQIALQGRKFGVGFIVIAQRTANVSKTVLTQCNTVVCFQAFDETSFAFLGNYVGKDMVQTLPNLKQYHAVVAGKSVKSNMPMIVDLTR